MSSLNVDYRLYLVTEAYHPDQDDEYFRKVESALRGGVTLLQFREKKASSKILYDVAKRLKQLAQQYEVPFIVNDRVDVALAVDADGVHIGQDDLPADFVRELIGHDKILGVSAATIDEAVKAERDGADYIGVGAVFPTSSKSDATVITSEMFQAIRERVDLPMVAIGGITSDNVKDLKTFNIDGIAVISAILNQKDCEQAARRLLEVQIKSEH
ncbi:thiamine phosphate synthase [Terrilactibacillus sp. BCM23-1]|uniref:Thiamine-phosphate synthase n=1 Tax=Terrilactibacillus tamarindi TaxID=2599694 RepID=A0A6N8CPL8_9BACI|nr:thiamine phosphate synthase [Terrilactibacillus tamarindi]MTT32114.1 thiamine phosphate synthase [Terrilactibacillus tamarindi]